MTSYFEFTANCSHEGSAYDAYLDLIQDVYEDVDENETDSDDVSDYDSGDDAERDILMALNERIQQVFCPQSLSERKCLVSIANEFEYIDIKPYSHNIIGMNLRELVENEGYYPAKIQEVVRMFELEKKGWAYLLNDENYPKKRN